MATKQPKSVTMKFEVKILKTRNLDKFVNKKQIYFQCYPPSNARVSKNAQIPFKTATVTALNYLEEAPNKTPSSQQKSATFSNIYEEGEGIEAVWGGGGGSNFSFNLRMQQNTQRQQNLTGYTFASQYCKLALYRDDNKKKIGKQIKIDLSEFATDATNHTEYFAIPYSTLGRETVVTYAYEVQIEVTATWYKINNKYIERLSVDKEEAANDNSIFTIAGLQYKYSKKKMLKKNQKLNLQIQNNKQTSLPTNDTSLPEAEDLYLSDDDLLVVKQADNSNDDNDCEVIARYTTTLAAIKEDARKTFVANNANINSDNSNISSANVNNINSTSGNANNHAGFFSKFKAPEKEADITINEGDGFRTKMAKKVLKRLRAREQKRQERGCGRVKYFFKRVTHTHKPTASNTNSNNKNQIDIGKPTNTSHDGSIWYSEEHGLVIDNLPKDWQEVLSSLNVSEEQLRDNNFGGSVLLTIQESLANKNNNNNNNNHGVNDDDDDDLNLSAMNSQLPHSISNTQKYELATNLHHLKESVIWEDISKLED